MSDAASSLSISPVPSDEEAAAIVAAVQMGLPGAAEEPPRTVSRWRFSGRWWSRPIPARRPRPGG